MRFDLGLILRKKNMLSIPGIAVQTLIYESANSLVYRAIRKADNQRIILKLLKESYPTPQELLRSAPIPNHRELKEAGVVRVYACNPIPKQPP